jgi:hypothetical protein
MKRIFIASALLVAASIPATSSYAQSPAPASAYNVEATDIGTLLDDPAAKAIVDKHLPGFTANDQISMARGMTLKAVQQYAPDMVTDKALAAIQTDLGKLPATK